LENPADQPANGPLPGFRLLAGLPGTIWALGLVSLLMDVSTEMIESLMPVFIVTVLGLGALSVGLVTGMAETTAALTKIFSGWLSDRLGRRKALALAGYGLATLAKPFFALATGLGVVLAARFVDRLGKGIRAAPRDALLADLAPEAKRGAAFGLRKALDSTGATLGPLIAFGLMAALGENIRLVFWLATIPAVLCVAVLAFGVREPSPHQPFEPRTLPKPWQIGQLGPAFGGFLLVSGAFHLAGFSEAFLLLKGLELGWRPAHVPLLLVVLNLVYAATAYLAGRHSDRLEAAGRNRARLIYLGVLPLIAAYIVAIVAAQPWHALLAAALWGLHLGMTQGSLPTMVADLAPADRRGTAFGAYHFMVGLAVLPAGLLAGFLWQSFGSIATFGCGSALGLIALGAFALWRARQPAG
jgi:MFS family permease